MSTVSSPKIVDALDAMGSQLLQASPVALNDFAMATTRLNSVLPVNHHRQKSSAMLEDDPTIGDVDYRSNRPHLRQASANKINSRSSPRKGMGGGVDEPEPSGGVMPIKRSTSFKLLLPIKDISRSPIKSLKKQAERVEEKTLKKSKSSSSLSNLLSRPRSSKGAKADAHTQKEKEKENVTPPQSASSERPPPIWAQFATTATLKVPLNDGVDRKEGVACCTSKACSPSQEAKSQSIGRRILPSRGITKARPKSDCLESGLSATDLFETLSGPRRSARQKHNNTIEREDLIPSLNVRSESSPQRKDENKNYFHVAKRSSKVLQTAALFDETANSTPRKAIERPISAPLNPEAIESAFETLLDTRNVPLATRDKMRSLDTNIKADFIRQDKAVTSSTPKIEVLSLQRGRDTAVSMPGNGDKIPDDLCEQPSMSSPRKSRPRSLTFTLSKGDQSPSKRQKSGSHQRTKSGEISPLQSSYSPAPASPGRGLSFFARSDKFALPEQVITYLQKFPAPQSVEVGKIQKLRQLLRNETVGWVENFVTQGGLTELVGLLHRIIAVEWREEHEDVLLHEVLLCLKALSTTSSAMAQLSSIQNTLVPTLLRMLFDEERKGPSEYSTRTIIINLLQSYLAASVDGSFASRANNLQIYLRDQSPPEEARAPEFIDSIYHPRPYRTWHKELNNLTKEVFWIFLHHHNIIPYTSLPPEQSSYQSRHFPKEHPPVAAAPYIGGVEWDAMAYVTAHLDLINGLIASLPTNAERNALRQEMKDSGFEKLMGASFRTCKEKFYGSVHEALSVWISAAREDGWPDKDVRQGPPKDEIARSPIKKGNKKNQAPILDMPEFDVGVKSKDERGGDEGWL